MRSVFAFYVEHDPSQLEELRAAAKVQLKLVSLPGWYVCTFVFVLVPSMRAGMGRTNTGGAEARAEKTNHHHHRVEEKGCSAVGVSGEATTAAVERTRLGIPILLAWYTSTPPSWW